MKLNKIMQWFTGNIGFHHIHHLNVRIPFYRLPEAMAAIPELQSPITTTLSPRDIRDCFSLITVGRETSAHGFLSGSEQDGVISFNQLAHGMHILTQIQRFNRCFHPAIIVLPVIIRVIDIELHLVTIRVSQVDTLTDSMVR